MCQRRKAPPPGPWQIQESARKRSSDATCSAWASVARSMEPPCGAITATFAQERRTVVSASSQSAEDVRCDVDGRRRRFVHEQPAQRRVAHLDDLAAAAGCRHGVGDVSAAGVHQDLPAASGRAEVRRDGKVQQRECVDAQGDSLAGRIEVRAVRRCATARWSRPHHVEEASVRGPTYERRPRRRAESGRGAPGRRARPSGSSSPRSSKATTPLQSRLHPCSGWAETTLAASRSGRFAGGQGGRCRHMTHLPWRSSTVRCSYTYVESESPLTTRGRRNLLQE